MKELTTMSMRSGLCASQFSALRSATAAVTCFATLLTAAACATGSMADEVGPEEEACEHGANGPFLEVTATNTGADAPEVSEEHTAYRVGLPAPTDGTTERKGYVRFASGEEGDLMLFTGSDLAIAVYDSAGVAVSAEFI
ncbi:MAG: hypothetical protein ACO3JL_12055, partial [Myxococcota bacterium]